MKYTDGEKNWIKIFEDCTGVSFEDFVKTKKRWRNLPHSEIIRLLRLAKNKKV